MMVAVRIVVAVVVVVVVVYSEIQSMTIVNIVDCVPWYHHVRRK